MCNPASFVLTKDQVFWSMKTDSHENIIAEFGLAQDGVRGPNILRVEITPPKMFDYGTPAEQWNFKLDQDLLPPWFDATADEIRARLALVEWIEKRVIREKTKRECRDGIFFAVDNSQVTAWDNSQVTARGNSQVTAVDNSQVTAWDNSQVTAVDNSQVTAWDNSQVTARDNSQVTVRDNSQVTARDNSQVAAWDNSQVTARGNSTVNQWNTNNVQPPQENAVVIDRCCITPKCIVATRK